MMLTDCWLQLREVLAASAWESAACGPGADPSSSSAMVGQDGDAVDDPRRAGVGWAAWALGRWGAGGVPGGEEW